MNKVMILIVLGCLVMVSCDKETGDSINNSTGLTGKWDWLSSNGGFGGWSYTHESTGDKRMVQFTPDSMYRFYLNDSLITECKYHLIKSRTIYYQDKAEIIAYDDQLINQSYFISHPDTLILLDECYDCFTSVYKRINE